MYKIGEFAKKINSSIRTLRFYDEIGILKPNTTDNFTSYRYYNEDNISEYHAIKILKDVGFTLEEIKEHRNNLSDEILLLKKKELLKSIIEHKVAIKQIDMIRSNIRNGIINISNDIAIPIITRKKDVNE